LGRIGKRIAAKAGAFMNEYRRVLRFASVVVLLSAVGQVGWAQTPAIPPADNAAAATLAESEKMGQAPENNSQQFLREDTILLKPGEWKLDAGLSYIIDEKPFTQLAVVQPGNSIVAVNSLLHRRLLVADLDIRYGLAERVQLFAALPVGWTNTEISNLGNNAYSNDGGLGDTSLGASVLWHKGRGSIYDPDVVVTMGMTAPTSHGDLLVNLLVTPQASLGQGLWAGYWNVLFIHTYDPVIVFYGFGSRHTLASDFDGFSVRAGDQYTYRFGLGFAVNDRVTFSGTLFGSYITDVQLNNQLVPGTSLEPVYLRFAATLAQCRRITEPFVEFGLTNDAVNARYGVTWTF
jgi:hypothetical protein